MVNLGSTWGQLGVKLHRPTSWCPFAMALSLTISGSHGVGAHVEVEFKVLKADYHGLVSSTEGKRGVNC